MVSYLPKTWLTQRRLAQLLVKLRNMTAITVLALILAVGLDHQWHHFSLSLFGAQQFCPGSWLHPLNLCGSLLGPLAW
jgi:hypothetical protein